VILLSPSMIKGGYIGQQSTCRWYICCFSQANDKGTLSMWTENNHRHFIIQKSVWRLAGYFLVFAVFPIPLSASEFEHASPPIGVGQPLIQHFSPSDYGGGAQNWSVVQDRRGVIYIGNVDSGLLEFDGVRWRRILIPGMTTVRSLAADDAGRVFVGAVGEFGYLAPDQQGLLEYVSLSDQLPEEKRDFADVWDIMVTDTGVYFQAFARLIRWSDGRFDSWLPEHRFHIAKAVDQRIFLREEGRGLLELVEDRLQQVPGGELFSDEPVYAILPAQPGGDGTELLLGTRNLGWFIGDGESFRPWDTDAASQLTDAHLYSATWLDSGVLAVATLSGGLFLLDQHGRLLKSINRTGGLVDNAVFALHEDHQGGLWLALNNGVTRLELGGSLSYFGEHSGLRGIVLVIHQHKDTLYVGTTEGLFRKLPTNDGVTRFEAVDGLRGQVWDLLDWDEQLLVASMHGVHTLVDGQFDFIHQSAAVTFSLLRSHHDPARLYIGFMDGIASMLYEDGAWTNEGRIEGIDDEVRALRETRDGDIWAGTRNTGALHMRFSGVQPPLKPQIQRYGLDAQAPARGEIRVLPFSDRLLFGTDQGLYHFDWEIEQLAPDPDFDHLFPEGPRGVSVLAQDPAGRLWVYSYDAALELRETGLLKRDESGGYHWDPSPFGPISGTTVVAMTAPVVGELWLGVDDRLYHYRVSSPAERERPFHALIRRVTEREDGRVFLAGSPLSDDLVLEYADNSLRFEYAATSYDSMSSNEYRVRLDHMDQGWSTWSREALRDYTNLPPGEYRFRVQARNVYGRLSEEAVFAFEVLPPWYRTWWAYLLWSLIGTSTIYAAYMWRSMNLRRRNLALGRLVAERTRALSRANRELAAANQALSEQSLTDPLTGLYNRRFLVAQIDNDLAAVQRKYRDRLVSSNTSEQTDLVFFMIDIDHFKTVNDEHGHASGDRVLVQVADILKGVMRASDIIVRWGGEEFLLVARPSDINSAPVLAERIRLGVAGHLFDLGEGRTARLSCSVGFAPYPLFAERMDETGWEDVVNAADQCLYAAKHHWRDAWVGVRALLTPPENVRAPFAPQINSLAAAGCLQIFTSRGELQRLGRDSST
jgi:diguanylate cyclase (GGDEF)-like protein